MELKESTETVSTAIAKHLHPPIMIICESGDPEFIIKVGLGVGALCICVCVREREQTRVGSFLYRLLNIQWHHSL